MSTPDDPLILVAAIVGAFGVRGELRIKSFTADPKGFARYGILLDEAGVAILTPKSVRTIKNGVALTAPEVTSPEQAKGMKSTALYVRRSALPEGANEDEYYVTDLVGLAVETLTGEPSGKVKAVHDFGAGDMLEIQPKTGPSWFLPFTRLDVPLVDMAKRKIVIDPPDILPDQTKETA